MFRAANYLGGFQIARALRIEGRLPDDVLLDALRVAQVRLPLLRASIEDSAGVPRFDVEERPWAVPLATVDRESETHWHAIAENDINTSFPDEGPLWRVTFVRCRGGSERSELILSFHHAIVDGTSITALADALLADCAARLTGRPMCPPDPQPLAPPVDALVAGPAAWRRNLRFGLTHSRRVLGRRPALLGVNQAPFVALEGRRTRFHGRQLDAAASAALVARCAAEHTTVHGALCAAMLATVRTMLPDVGRSLSCYSNISLRGRCQPPVSPDQFGCFIYWVGTVHRPHPMTRFWDLARQCARAVHQAAAREGVPPRVVVPRAGLIRRAAELALRRAARNRWMGRTDTVGVSNLGRLRLADRYGPLRIESIYSLATQHAVGVSAALIATTLVGRMFFTFPYAWPLLDPALVDEMAARFVNTLQRATAPGELQLADVATTDPGSTEVR